MVAGPIKRYGQFDEQLQQAQFSANHMLEGFFRIVIGLFKKMVIADNLSTIIQEIGSPDKTRSVVMLSVAVFLYGFRIYFDFSGYSDIAIGSARLFGIRVPENFLHPYRQSNISAFWRSWHVSLYSWLIDYVFIPLGGSRAGFFRALANIMIVMLVSGLWHGAAWNFVLWGFWHGMLLVIHKIYAEKIKPALDLKLLSGRGALAASYTLTMAGVWFGWLLFMWPLHDGANYMKLAYNSLF
jgi:alginate O-acetyltransferase complex protein AlgI